MLAHKVASVVDLTQGHLPLSTKEKTWGPWTSFYFPIRGYWIQEATGTEPAEVIVIFEVGNWKALEVSAVRIRWALPGPMNLRWETSPVRIRLH